MQVVGDTHRLMVSTGAGLSATPSSLYRRPEPSGSGKNTDPACGAAPVAIVSGRNSSLYSALPLGGTVKNSGPVQKPFCTKGLSCQSRALLFCTVTLCAATSRTAHANATVPLTAASAMHAPVSVSVSGAFSPATVHCTLSARRSGAAAGG